MQTIVWLLVVLAVLAMPSLPIATDLDGKFGKNCVDAVQNCVGAHASGGSVQCDGDDQYGG